MLNIRCSCSSPVFLLFFCAVSILFAMMAISSSVSLKISSVFLIGFIISLSSNNFQRILHSFALSKHSTFTYKIIPCLSCLNFPVIKCWGDTRLYKLTSYVISCSRIRQCFHYIHHSTTIFNQSIFQIVFVLHFHI